MGRTASSVAKVAKPSNRGSAPGEHRGGRVKGTPNKATASIREAAQQYTDEALKTLVEVMGSGEAPPAARVAAANSILDRGHGKPQQSIDHQSSDGSMTPAKTLVEFYGKSDGGQT